MAKQEPISGSRRSFVQGAAALGGALLSGALAAEPTPAEAAAVPQAAAPPDDGKLRIICFGAHPDDCEIRIAGCAAKWAAQGHHVKFVPLTNGDIGHWQMAGGPLAQRRRAEVEQCAKILGITTQVLDIHDGELIPTLEYRRDVTRLIRHWKADLVFSHRPNDYHPDHRNVGVLVQDAAYMVTVPFFCPDTPHLTRNPAFFFYQDGFQKPNPFNPDVVVAIDDVIEKKLDALDALVSQFFEGGANGSADLIPKDEAGRVERARQVREGFRNRNAGPARQYREKLREFYGDKADAVKYAEPFEICEYGRRPSKDELKRLFPFFS
jgi:LmbE family N-acetylglucosaminyl deacetylase